VNIFKSSALVLVFTIVLVFGSVGCGQQAGSVATTSFRAPSKLTTISKVTGEVLVLKAGATDWSPASSGMSLEAGDRIKTGAGSNAVITFFDGSTIELAADTEISVSELGIAERTGSTVINLWQQVGKTRSRVEKLVDPASRYEIETPAGAAVVRGSVGDVEVDKDGTTKITNIEGRWCGIGQGKEVCIPQGYFLIIIMNQVPGVPAPIAPPPILPTPELTYQPPLRPASERSTTIQGAQSPRLYTWTQTTVLDFITGASENVTVVDVGGGDGTVMLLQYRGQETTAYYPSGTLESSSYDCARLAVFDTISWDGQTPDSTSLKFQIATNNDNSTWNFVGPDGTPATYYETSGMDIWSGHDGNRFIKYKAYLGTPDPYQTPSLEEVRITFH
jgi:hypothetical protein